ncbi:hypothetical protein V8F06_001904 [Rhypophila decipiens]
MRLLYTLIGLLSAPGLCHDAQQPVGTMRVPEPEREPEPEYFSFPVGEPHPDYLNSTFTRFKLRDWGFVIVRTTYSSDTKWAEFMTILNDNIRFWFTLHDNQHLSHLLDKHVVTVLQDAAKLENANLGVTAQVFDDWVRSPQAQGRTRRHRARPRRSVAVIAPI